MTRITTGVPSRSVVSTRKAWSGSFMSLAVLPSRSAHGLREDEKVLRLHVNQPVARAFEIRDQAACDRDRDRQDERHDPARLRALGLEADEKAAEERERDEQRPGGKRD